MVRVLTRFRGPGLAFGACLLAAATVAACAGKALDVGSDEPKGVGGSGVGGRSTSGPEPASAAPALTPEELAAAQWPADTPCLASPGSPKVGIWKGHWPEPVGFSNPEVVLHIKGLTSEGLPCGTLAIGDGPAPPPVTDRNAIYPPMAGVGGGISVGSIGSPLVQPWPGYEYRLLDVEASDTRLAFTVTYQELLRPWCQLQPAVEESRTCLPVWDRADGPTDSRPDDCSIWGPNLPETTVPCFKTQYCSKFTCFCHDGACDVSRLGSKTVLELHWDGAALEGSVNQTQLIFLDPVP